MQRRSEGTTWVRSTRGQINEGSGGGQEGVRRGSGEGHEATRKRNRLRCPLRDACRRFHTAGFPLAEGAAD
eukprot:1160609-Prorocentrum_minimum.AAC.2